MPELPEVETIVNDLKKILLKRRIVDVWTDTKKLIKQPDFEIFKKQVKGLLIKNIRRRGKNILIDLSNDLTLLIHQKLTGHLLYGKWSIQKNKAIPLIHGALEDPMNNFIHVVFYLDNNYQLALSDLRKFAKIILAKTDEIENLKEIKEIGPDPLDKNFDFETFKKAIKKQRGKIKQVLMEQKVIAGIGNIYSDEILWWAKIHPLRTTASLTDEELKKLYHYTLEVLKTAIKARGSSVSDYRDPKGEKGSYDQIRRVYRRENQKCYRCGTLIKRIKIGGRSSCFCPNCQKL
ncbi:MAG: bifunctional DNA-formamidopyrimidine glycosylase/DNA-(apurinic or apyrimidinic site) lyase [Patescibacteria group bacterium]|jgi:formamidopyrimidine-DNA glycosylase|nr:bifunctional DNA-formamidopyrimidine glycosylase/DNA-(apurinic or apyrimidinic site) lyase [Patescibacteria group bacterium]